MGTKEEIEAGCKEHGIELPPKEKMDAIFSSLDSDQSGVIDYVEFLVANATPPLGSRDDLVYAAFKVYDQDGNGEITVEEMIETLAPPQKGMKIDSTAHDRERKVKLLM